MESYDLFGRAILDHYKGDIHPLYLERDDGHVDEQSIDIYFSEFKDFLPTEQDALKHVRGRVLDIGLGAGRVALYLQGLGHDVVGIDLSEKAVEASKSRGVRNVLRMSACEMRFPAKSFDTAIAFFNNFGICGTVPKVESMMKDLHRIVRPGGVFLASSIQPTRTKNPSHLRYHRRNRALGLPPGQVRLRERYRDQVGPWWQLLMVTPGEMRAMCSKTGWKVNRTYMGLMDVYVLSRV